MKNVVMAMVLVISLSAIASAASIVREGTVADSNTGLIIAGASVSATGGSVTTTDEQGFYRMTVEEAEILTIESDGYDTMIASGADAAQPVLWLTPTGKGRNLFSNPNLQGDPVAVKSGFRLPEYYPSAYEGEYEHGIDGSMHRLGNRSLKLHGLTPARLNFSQRIEVQPGAWYRFKVWYRHDENMPPEAIQVRLLTYMNYPTQLRIDSPEAYSTQVISGIAHVNWQILHLGATEWALDDWKPLEIEFRTPEGVTEIGIEFFLWKAAGTAWFAEPILVRLDQ